MTVDVHDDIRQRLADHDGPVEDPELLAHLDACEDCRRWQHAQTRVRTTAPTLYAVDDSGHDKFVDRVVAAVGRARRRRLGQRCAAVAAAVVLVAGAGWLIRDRAGTTPARNRVAVALAKLDDGPVRLVYSASAAVEAAPRTTAFGSSAVALLTALPTCTTSRAIEPVGADTTELSDLVDTLTDLLADDPCRGLDQVASTLGAAAEASAQHLIADRDVATRLLTTVDTAVAVSPLQAASLEVVASRATARRDAADRHLAELRRQAAATATSLQPIVDAANHHLPVDGLESGAGASLHALAAIIDTTTPATDPDIGTVEWSQLATATLTPDSVHMAGTTTAADGTAAELDAHSDSLGLTPLLFDEATTLRQVLDTAPPSDDDTAEWTVAPELIRYPGIDTWTARLHLDDERLDELTLTGSGAATTITLTVTFGR